MIEREFDRRNRRQMNHPIGVERGDNFREAIRLAQVAGEYFD